MTLAEQSELAASLAAPPSIEEIRAMRVRFSNLRYMAQSPAHYYAAITEPREASPAMRFGSLVHAIVLGGEYVVAGCDARRGKPWDAACAEAAKRGIDLIVTVPELERASRVASAVHRHPEAARYLDGEHERLIEWTYAPTQRVCRSKLDVLGRGFIADLKTTTSAHPARFVRHALQMLYHAQLAFYDQAAISIGVDTTELVLIAVEVQPPFAVTVWKLSERAIEDGRRATRLWMEMLASAEASNAWPAYADAAVLDLDAAEEESVLTLDGEAL